jgi:hypothetical protein
VGLARNAVFKGYYASIINIENCVALTASLFSNQILL